MSVKLLDSDALAEGQMMPVQVDDLAIAIYRIDGVVYATSNICTHQYALMTDGYFDGRLIECSLHQGLFDVKTGAALEGPVTEGLKCFPVEEREGGIFLRTV